MGDFEQGTIDESTSHNPRARLKAVILLGFGIFAPFLVTLTTWGMNSRLNIQSMFWIYTQSTYMSDFDGFSVIHPYVLMSMFPFLLFRMVVPVSMMYRYYNGKITKKSALIASCAGDGVFLIFGLPSVLLSSIFGMGYYIIPLPIQMIVGILILWRSPMPESTTPWEDITKPKSYWKQKSETQQERPSEDKDKLW
jgi:hypothetical protein